MPPTRYQIILEVTPRAGSHPARKLARLLKVAGREMGLECVDAVEVPAMPAETADHVSIDLNLNLDRIEAGARRSLPSPLIFPEDVLHLVQEVRQLRAEVQRLQTRQTPALTSA